jgi:WD40 repeat protein
MEKTNRLILLQINSFPENPFDCFVIVDSMIDLVKFYCYNWCVFKVFVGWGHISRLWDVVFLGEHEDRVATCSEDSTIKLWNIEKKCCIATLRGHASDIWCLALASFNKGRINQTEGSTPHKTHSYTNHSGENLILFSGGNDSSVKAWPLSSQEISCQEDPSASLRQFPIPPVPTQNEVQGTSRRSNGVSAVRLSPSGLRGVVCLCDGGLWLVSFSTAVTPLEATAQAGAGMPLDPTVSNSGWIHLGNLEKDITNADVIFHDIVTISDGVDNQPRYEPSYEGISLTVFCAHPDGFVSEVKFSYGATDGSHVVDLSLKRHSWAAHKLRTINVWCQVLTDGSRGHDICYIVSASVRGVCRVWGPELGPGLGFASAGDTSHRLLFEGSTGKENVATCVLLQPGAFIVGDSKGGITIFTLPDSAADWSSLSVDTKGTPPPKIFIPHAHGTELVSCLESNPETGGFYSAGHDGSFCIFSGTGEIVSRLKCLPIKTPDKVFIVGRGDEISYYIGGFLGGLYLVYDIRKGYQVLRLEGGGWKRYVKVKVVEGIQHNSDFLYSLCRDFNLSGNYVCLTSSGKRAITPYRIPIFEHISS